MRAVFSILFSLASGERQGVAFGSYAAVSDTGDMLAIEHRPGQVELYRASTMEKIDELRFASPVAAFRFRGDGKQFFVLTEAQDAYIFELNQMGKAN